MAVVRTSPAQTTPVGKEANKKAARRGAGRCTKSEQAASNLENALHGLIRSDVLVQAVRG